MLQAPSRASAFQEDNPEQAWPLRDDITAVLLYGPGHCSAAELIPTQSLHYLFLACNSLLAVDFLDPNKGEREMREGVHLLLLLVGSSPS